MDGGGTGWKGDKVRGMEEEDHFVSVSAEPQAELVSTNYIRVRQRASRIRIPSTARRGLRSPGTHSASPNKHTHITLIIISSIPRASSLCVAHTPTSQPAKHIPIPPTHTDAQTSRVTSLHCLPIPFLSLSPPRALHPSIHPACALLSSQMIVIRPVIAGEGDEGWRLLMIAPVTAWQRATRRAFIISDNNNSNAGALIE